MAESFLPDDLLHKCKYVVRTIHDKHGLDALPRKATSGAYIVALHEMSDTRYVMNMIALASRFAIVSWIVAGAFLILSITIAWWALIGVALSVLVAKWLATRQREGWLFQGTILLGMEMLSTDFCGWGTAYPELRNQAAQLLNDDLKHPKTIWLDY